MSTDLLELLITRRLEIHARHLPTKRPKVLCVRRRRKRERLRVQCRGDGHICFALLGGGMGRWVG